jgi:hypothetical protein
LKPHFRKVAHFLKLYPRPLISTEFCILAVLWIDGKRVTYNPDFYDPKTRTYVEVSTSRGNICAQRKKWEAAREIMALRIYWWEGQEITKTLFSTSVYEGPKLKSRT